ncbi:SDR family NAD(P)-dependent oxidoreductase [Streptomyces sp. NPDC017529]|uniref:SDR family NAD(P)-dependent oxidoreductase n=1 Tax=Streptomyces sp. NPDC017529 TaxID=3365000 RepID=UPI00378E7D65
MAGQQPLSESRRRGRAESHEVDGKCFQLHLEDKTVVVYGVSDPQGMALAKALSRRRALIFLADSVPERVESAARGIVEAGGAAESAEVDLSDGREVEDYTSGVAQWTGGIDVAVVAVGGDHAVTQLTVARAVASHMAARGRGLIVVTSVRAASERGLRHLAQHIAPRGVTVLPVFCGCDAYQSAVLP